MLMFNQMTIIRCDKVIISIQLSIYQINWIDIESNGNKETLIGHDALLSIESNRIASHRFEQGDVEPIDHEALRSATFGFIVLRNNFAGK